MTTNNCPNTDTEQLAKALEREPQDAREIAACIWNMVCAAVRELKAESER